MLFSFASLTSLAIGGHAYLDPGTGSYLLQIILAAGMSGLFLVGVFRKKLAAFFRRLFRREADSPAQDGGQRDDD
jgi:hypothetical protein